MAATSAPASRYYTFNDVIALTGLSRSTLQRWEVTKLFPRRVVLGPGRLAWKRSEIEAWLTDREAHHRKRI